MVGVNCLVKISLLPLGPKRIRRIKAILSTYRTPVAKIESWDLEFELVLCFFLCISIEHIVSY